MIHAKFNLKIYYPPLYEWDIWHYQKANVENIGKTIDQFPRAIRFTNIDVNEKLNLFKESSIKYVHKFFRKTNISTP